MQQPFLNDGSGAGGSKVVDRRTQLVYLATAIGLGTPLICYIMALSGVKSADFPTDKVATVGVLFSVYMPFLAFYNNEGEKRPLKKQLLHFGVLWTMVNLVY